MELNLDSQTPCLAPASQREEQLADSLWELPPALSHVPSRPPAPLLLGGWACVTLPVSINPVGVALTTSREGMLSDP